MGKRGKNPMLSHFKNIICLEKIAAKFYISVTQTVAVMLRLMEANYNAAF